MFPNGHNTPAIIDLRETRHGNLGILVESVDYNVNSADSNWQAGPHVGVGQTLQVFLASDLNHWTVIDHHPSLAWGDLGYPGGGRFALPGAPQGALLVSSGAGKIPWPAPPYGSGHFDYVTITTPGQVFLSLMMNCHMMDSTVTRIMLEHLELPVGCGDRRLNPRLSHKRWTIPLPTSQKLPSDFPRPSILFAERARTVQGKGFTVVGVAMDIFV